MKRVGCHDPDLGGCKPLGAGEQPVERSPRRQARRGSSRPGTLTSQWWLGNGQSLRASERPLPHAGYGQERPAGEPASNEPLHPNGGSGERTGIRPAILTASLSAVMTAERGDSDVAAAVSKMIPGDWGKVGSGWLTQPRPGSGRKARTCRQDSPVSPLAFVRQWLRELETARLGTIRSRSEPSQVAPVGFGPR
jgi:hypothetical protein